jgi:hypothetical protein
LIVTKIQHAYDVQICGNLTWILGQHVTNTPEAITIDQHLYITKLLEKFSMQDSNPVSTPAVEATPPTASDTAANMTEYRSMVGSLMHASNGTRPDITFATNQVCRHMSGATNQDLVAVKRILRYLRGHADTVLTYTKSTTAQEAQVKIVGYCDASWGNDLATARSISGYVFYIGTGPVSWSSRLQHTTALSSTEAEYVSASAAAQEATWLRMFVEELGFPQPEPTTMFVDNQAAIQIANNPVFHARTKHINIKFHHIRDLIEQRTIHLEWCPTADMVADIYTKPLLRVLFQRHACKLVNNIKE